MPPPPKTTVVSPKSELITPFNQTNVYSKKSSTGKGRGMVVLDFEDDYIKVT